MKNAIVITILEALFCVNAQAYDEKKREEEKEKEQMEVALKALTFPNFREWPLVVLKQFLVVAD